MNQIFKHFFTVVLLSALKYKTIGGILFDCDYKVQKLYLYSILEEPK